MFTSKDGAPKTVKLDAEKMRRLDALLELNLADIDTLKALIEAAQQFREKYNIGPEPLAATIDKMFEHGYVAHTFATMKVGRADIAKADPEKIAAAESEEEKKRWGELPLPFRAHVGEDVGYDLCTAIDLVIEPGKQAFVPTGFIFNLPVHSGNFRVEMKIEQRTGTGTKGAFAAAKTVDPGYRPNPDDANGLVLSLRNVDSTEPLVFKRGDRIAQAIFSIKYAPDLVEVPKEDIDYNTARGPKKFGDTGR